jgi:aldehyde dehydrogenase (NAD+)
MQYISVTNPYDDSLVTGGVEVAGAEDIDLAVASATAALRTGPWGIFTGAQRAACMLKLADIVEKNAEDLAYLESISMGRPIATLLGMDIPHMANCYRC